jgi:hypothetical protein
MTVTQERVSTITVRTDRQTKRSPESLRRVPYEPNLVAHRRVSRARSQFP